MLGGAVARKVRSVKRLLLAACALLLAACGSDDPLLEGGEPELEPSPSPSASIQQPIEVETGYIVTKIADQYGRQARREVEIECPERVLLAEGEVIVCRALDVAAGRRHLADIEVTIVNDDGEFEWKADPR